jgi:branched-chain amino acid transport system ATP-binding protein
MLAIEGLEVFYGPVQALRGVSLTVGQGEIVALLGSNGAGKTTTLRAASGMVPASAGSIRIDGHDVKGLPPQKVVRLGVAHMPEGRELFPEMTVTENLRLGHWSRRGERGRFQHRLTRAFELFPRLEERAGQAAGTLSGGEQQMLVFARALMSEPKLLLIDELSLGLAPLIVSQLFAAIEEVNAQGTAVLLVEQFVHLALKHSSRAYVLGRGEVVAEGPSNELLASPELIAAYLGSTEPAPTVASSNGHATHALSEGAV